MEEEWVVEEVAMEEEWVVEEAEVIEASLSNALKSFDCVLYTGSARGVMSSDEVH